MPMLSKSRARQMGIKRKSLQTILIPISWSLQESRDWLKKHGYLWQYYRTTDNFRRFQQVYDIKDASFYTKVLPNNVELVFQQY